MGFESQIVLFEFPKQTRTSLKPPTVLARITKLIGATAKLYTPYGLIKGMNQVSQLTVCPMAVTKAIQVEFGRGPLSSLQKAGRAVTTALKVKMGTKAVPTLTTKTGFKRKLIEVDDEVEYVTPPEFSTRSTKAKN